VVTHAWEWFLLQIKLKAPFGAVGRDGKTEPNRLNRGL
jgi:hypothetical protein